MWLAVGRGGGGNQTQIQTSSPSLFQSMLRVDYVKQKQKLLEKTQSYLASHPILFSMTDTEIQGESGKLLACSLLLLFYPGFQHITTESRDAQTDPLRLNYRLPQDAVSQWMVPNVAGRATHAAVASPYLLIRQGFQTSHLLVYSISPDHNPLKQHKNRHVMCLLLIFSFKFLCYFWNRTRLELDEPNVTSLQRVTSLSLVTGNTK